ncbi:MAG TPA: lasso peptide biosynthesis B2 protein [Candidatus Acidoferrales bacterium]|nr:lasso peptide biosynthesis B2 protein [Candidatus Acidoferrales bacterium]
MISVWKRYRRLTRRERNDLLLGFVLLPTAVVFVRMFGIRRWQRTAEARRGNESGDGGKTDVATLNEARATARMLDAASRYGVVRGNCLSQSVALLWLLRRRGLPGELRIGARRIGSELEAHAWVELRGEIVNDAEDVRESYATFREPMTSQIAARK